MAVRLSELRGHRNSVNSVSVRENLLASASDDGTVRLWDLRRRLTVMRVTDPDFGMLLPVDNVLLDSDVTLYLTVASKLYWFDLRKAQSVSLAKAEGVLAEVADDINQIAKQEGTIVLPDDSGSLTFLRDHEFSFSLRGLHSNICSSFAFSPNGDLGISGDLSSCAVLLDLESGRTERRFELSKIVGSSHVNPPYVNSLDWTSSGLAIALGDGNVVVYDGADWEAPTEILQAHLGRVFLTSWANFASRLLLTASNEPNLGVWEGSDLLFRVELPDKPNWMDSDWNSPSVYVADTSSAVRVLTFPS